MTNKRKFLYGLIILLSLTGVLFFIFPINTWNNEDKSDFIQKITQNVSSTQTTYEDNIDEKRSNEHKIDERIIINHTELSIPYFRQNLSNITLYNLLTIVCDKKLHGKHYIRFPKKDLEIVNNVRFNFSNLQTSKKEDLLMCNLYKVSNGKSLIIECHKQLLPQEKEDDTLKKYWNYHKTALYVQKHKNFDIMFVAEIVKNTPKELILWYSPHGFYVREKKSENIYYIKMDDDLLSKGLYRYNDFNLSGIIQTDERLLMKKGIKWANQCCLDSNMRLVTIIRDKKFACMQYNGDNIGVNNIVINIKEIVQYFPRGRKKLKIVYINEKIKFSYFQHLFSTKSNVEDEMPLGDTYDEYHELHNEGPPYYFLILL